MSAPPVIVPPDSLAAPAHRRASTGAGGRRAWWLKHLHRWHWISAATSLAGLLLFAITGFTLNHAADIEARPETISREATLPPPLLATLRAATEAGELPRKAPLPPAVRSWLEQALSVAAGDREAEWADDEIYLGMPRPGGDAWLRIDTVDGAVEYELTRRGWVSYLNDLHKGRHTGAAWSWFIDIFAAACLVFALTGLFILKLHSASRPGTWPLLGFGLLLPLLLALLFIH